MRIINKVCTIVLLLFVTSIQAQRSTSSPYSRFGYGLLNEKSLSFGQGLSNTGIALRPSNHLSFINPASLSAIDSSHFIFEVGVKNQFTTIETGGQKATTSNSNMEYLGVGFPITRWWGTGLTMIPFSKIGYSFLQSQTLADATTVKTYYYGIGGSNQVVWGNGFKPIKGLSIGINVGLIFGETTLEAYNALTTEILSENALKTNTIDMKGFYVESGVQYEIKLNNKKSIVLGAIFSPDQKLKSKNSLLVKTTVSGGTIVENTVDIPTKSDLPMKIGGGLGYLIKDKLQCGVDYKFQDWSKATIFESSSRYFQKMQTVNVGIEYLPNKYALSGYYKKIRYRFGARFLQSNIALPEKQSDTKLYSVNEMSASLGFGLPLKMSANNVNLAFEYGSRATKSAAMPKETFFVINLNFTLNENWFYKHKIK
jgi:hypothetical protein